MLGVEEYYLFDPLAEYIPRRLRAFRREQDLLLPVATPVIHSPRLGLELRVEEAQLRLFDPQSQRILGSCREEAEARREAEQARREAEQTRREAEQALTEERHRVAELEARLRELEGN